MPETSPQPPAGVPESARSWVPTSIDWSVAFPRSPQHLSNQLRGKRFHAERPQLELFDTTYQSLPDDIRKDVDRHNISVIGFDLTIPQQRAYEAGLYLLTATGWSSKRIVLTPADWLRAYGLEKRERNTRAWAEVSSKERDEAFAALVSLGIMPWLISYRSMVSGRWGEVTRVAPLWLCATRTDERPEPSRADPAKILSVQELAPLVQRFKHADLIEIDFNPIWLDQQDSYYFYRPAQLYQRISLAMTGDLRRRNRHTHPFLDWIFSEVGRIRVEERRAQQELGAAYTPRPDWTFSEDLTSLALQLRMTAQVSKRNWGRIRASITDNAALAQKAQIILAYEWQDDRLSITFNQKTFHDLDQYHEAVKARQARREHRLRRQRSHRPSVDGVEWPFPRPIRDYSPNQLRDMKKSQLAQLAAIRQKLRDEGSWPKNHAGPLVPRAPTAEEARAIAFHDAVVRMIEAALVPRPEGQGSAPSSGSMP